MSILGDDDSLLGSTPSGSEDNYVASLGRISGKLLSANLLRNGSDLTFRNGSTDPDLLYLDVNNMRVGINTDSPVYDLDVNSLITTTNASVTNRLTVDNVIVDAAGYFSTTVGPLYITPTGALTELVYQRSTTDNLELNNNTIGSFSNSDIVFDPNGTGTVELQTTTNVTGNVSVTGNIRVDGDLSAGDNIIVGDTPLDTVTIGPDFTQSIIPGDDNTWSLGEDTGDSSPRRWSILQSRDLSTTVTVRPDTAIVDNELRIDGIANTIFATQTNIDVLLNPDTGIVYIESTKWENDSITNLDNTPLTFANTGIGYVRYMGDNAIVIPSGAIADRRSSPEVGETRWNTDDNYLECFDGTVWAVSTGGGIEVTQEIMEDLSNVWTLVLG